MHSTLKMPKNIIKTKKNTRQSKFVASPKVNLTGKTVKVLMLVTNGQE
jgi:hypothetical protein